MADVQLADRIAARGADIKSAYEAQANTNAFTDAEKAALAAAQPAPSEGAFVDGDKTKLDGITAGATPTNTANVTAAGALMDSEVTNLADVKAFNPADYAAASHTHGGGDVTISGFTQGNAVVSDASGNLVDGGSPPGGSGTTNITIAESPTGVEVQSSSGTNDTIALANGTNAGAMSPAHYTRVEGVEDNATADQSDAEIETAYNNQVSVVSQAEAEAGTATTVRRWTAERVAQAIAALAGSSATDPSEYAYVNDGNQSGTYTPDFTSAAIIEISLTGDTEIQVPTHTGIETGAYFSGLFIVNTSTHTLTFNSSIVNYDKLATIEPNARVPFGFEKAQAVASWFLAPDPLASQIRNDSGVTGATVSAALNTLNSSFEPLLSSPADADYFTQRNSGNSALEYARKSLLFGAAIELTDGEVDLVDLPACVITGGKAWVAGGGTSATVNIKIAGTSITGLSALSATTSKPGSYTSATAANVAALGNALSVALTSSSGTGRVEVRLQGYYKRVA